MSLNEKTKELVAIGAAIGGDCIPCLMWHYNRSIELGTTKDELREAIDMATKVKEVPYRKTLEAAEGLLSKNSSL